MASTTHWAVASLGIFHIPRPSRGMESPVLANSSMGTLDARTSVVAGLKRATDSGVVVVDAMLDAGDG